MADTLNRRAFDIVDEAIKAYFNLGLRHRTILNFLEECHGIHLSIWSLRRRLGGGALDLQRHNYSNVEREVITQAVKQALAV